MIHVSRYSLVARALDLRFDGREFDSMAAVGWVTVFERANRLSISPSHPD